METQILVYADLDGTPHLAGRLWAHTRRNRQSATFEYDDGWLVHSNRFSLEPMLKLGPGPFHTSADRALFGAIGDSAPDRWGRVLMRRAERRRARNAGETPRTLREVSVHFEHEITEETEGKPSVSSVDSVDSCHVGSREDQLAGICF